MSKEFIEFTQLYYELNDKILPNNTNIDISIEISVEMHTSSSETDNEDWYNFLQELNSNHI